MWRSWQYVYFYNSVSFQFFLTKNLSFSKYLLPFHMMNACRNPFTTREIDNNGEIKLRLIFTCVHEVEFGSNISQYSEARLK